MVGFVFLIAFQSYASARSSASTEAGATAALFHAADAFPDPARGALQGDLICYSRAVVHDEWETMAEDGASSLVSRWESRLETTFESVRPVGITAGNARQNWFDETDARRGARRARLAEADPFVPSSIWFLLTIAFLDSAYGDHAGAITPKAMRGTQAALERERAARYPEVRVPCDVEGAPVGRAL